MDQKSGEAMKKALAIIFLFLVLLLTGCAEDALNSGNPFVQNGNLQVILDQGIKGITIVSSQVTNAVIRLTGPTGIVQTATWNLGNPNVFFFNADITGTYSFGLTQTDTSNQTASTNLLFDFISGYNYYITVNLGGYVTVNVQTNGSVSSSSVSSPVSSVSSSASSSVSSGSSTSSLSSSPSSSSSRSSSSSTFSSVSSSSASSDMSGIQVTDITSYTARIVWTTAVPATSQVLYGLDDWLPFQTAVDPALVTNHSVLLINLIPWGHYYFKTRSVDASGNIYQSGLLSFDTPIDLTPPVIGNVRVSNVTATGAIISWDTDEPGDSEVNCWYWEGSSKITLTRYTSSLIWSHQITVTGLPPQKLITFNVTSKNNAGFSSTSANFTFTTPAP